VPIQLDKKDIAILRALQRDGRKSFRQISRETGITTPTVKARFNRLVNIGFIESVSPIINFKVAFPGHDLTNTSKLRLFDTKKTSRGAYDRKQITKLRNGIQIQIKCNFCGGIIHGRPQVFKFANYERFFCCTACRADYKEKYAGKIEALTKRYHDNGDNHIFK
jgi:Lrp/AsnC family leucine-responsive transcriptional regulator